MLVGKIDSRFFVAVMFVIIFAAFMHFREVRIYVMEVDTVAKGYVVAQTDFAFPDDDATMVLKQEALRDVGRIYKINESELKKLRTKFESHLIHHPHWRRGNNVTFDEMYSSLDVVVEVLMDAKLTDSRTVKKREELGLTTKNFYIIPNVNMDFKSFPDTFWEEVRENVLHRQKSNEQSVDFIIEYFKQSSLKIYNDIDTQRSFQRKIEEDIPKKYTKVRAGSRIIDHGEKVTGRHVAMVNEMNKEIRELRNIWSIKTILGSLIISMLITFICSIYLRFRHREIFDSLRQIVLLVVIVTLTLAFSKIFESLLIYPSTRWYEFVRYPIIVPFATILTCVLMNVELSIFVTLVLTVSMGFALALEQGMFFFVNMVTGVCAVLATRGLKKRKEVFIVCVKIYLSVIVLVIAFNLINNRLFTPITLIDLGASASNLFIMAILLIGCLPILESIFNIMTDITLMEYMYSTNELLKRLSIEAPGTYQHSHSIGHIAEHVANAIGANGLFCRVTMLYHDIGKLNNPLYYTENQSINVGKSFNIHSLLTPIESVYIIKSHVIDGVALAKEYRLPQPFIDIIEQHHGTTLIKYFYTKQLEEVNGKVEDVDENAFRYPGPPPQSKEAAVNMICDSVEAASRSLDMDNDSDEDLENMINNIVNEKFSDSQFDQCNITCKELVTIKEKLLEVVKVSIHRRIKYPKDILKPEIKSEKPDSFNE